MKFHYAAAASALVCSWAAAGTVQIAVADADGRPAADVVVLIESATQPTTPTATAPIIIAQENLRFVPFLTVAPLGSTVRFVNRDTYDHHVRTVPSGPLGALPPSQNFEMRLDGQSKPASTRDDYPQSSAGKKSGTSSAEIKLDAAGPTGLGCHLHSSMRGQLYVAATPWFGKTDAQGRLTVDNVPDGAVDVKLWHPDQIQEQVGLKAQVTAAPATVNGKLNFTPRRRRG